MVQEREIPSEPVSPLTRTLPLQPSNEHTDTQDTLQQYTANENTQWHNAQQSVSTDHTEPSDTQLPSTSAGSTAVSEESTSAHLEECHIASCTGKQLELRESNGSSAIHGAISNVQNECIPEYDWALDHLQFISYRALGVPDREFTNLLKRSFELDPERYVK